MIRLFLKLTPLLLAFLIETNLCASDLPEINLSEEGETRPIFSIMWTGKNFETRYADASSSFPASKRPLKDRNAMIVTLQAREEFTRPGHQCTYKADEDGEVRFGLLLGTSGTLLDHRTAISLPEEFYFPGKKEDEKNTMTVLMALRQWATTLHIDDPNGKDQATLCELISIEVKK